MLFRSAGRISNELAVSFAENEYEKYRLKAISEKDRQLDDFEKSIKQIEQHSKRKK